MNGIVTVTAEPSLMEEVERLATAQGASASEPEPLNLDGSLNAGLTAEEFRQGVEAITLLFKAGSSLLVFLTALRAYLREKKSPSTVVIGDGSGAVRGRVEAATSDAELEKMTD